LCGKALRSLLGIVSNGIGLTMRQMRLGYGGQTQSCALQAAPPIPHGLFPLFTGNCHCKDCQRASGSAFVPAMIFPEADVVVRGEVKYFESKAESGNMHKRGFCPTCGSRMFATFEAMPGMLGIS
jgi:hypothetical protein